MRIELFLAAPFLLANAGPQEASSEPQSITIPANPQAPLLTQDQPPPPLTLLEPPPPIPFRIARPAAAPEPPPEIPLTVKAMIDAAMAAGNEAELNTIVKYANKTTPGSAKAINVYADQWRTDRRLKHERMVEEAGMFDLWKGRAEVGGWLTTGNSRNLGLTGVLDLTREGLRWRHKLHLQADYQRSFGVTTREHYLASYEPNYKIDDRSYIYGSTQYESDRLLGYVNRYSVSVGGGYSAIKRPGLTLNLELGPAYRDTDYTDDTNESSAALRGSFDFAWKLSRTVSLTQDAAAYLQHYNSTVSGTTALHAKLIGPLSAQLSYNVQYESEPPVGSTSTDTTSRASLVYSF